MNFPLAHGPLLAPQSQAADATATPASGLTFCIITHGRNPGKLSLTLQGIREQAIPVKEIIVVGHYVDGRDYIYLEAREAAEKGLLGVMRNLGVSQATQDHVVLLDDDVILTPFWSERFFSFREPFEIMTSRVRVPDGTRFWDHATFFGPRGQQLLDMEERDDANVYMSGGTAWVISREAARSVRWDDSLGFYQKEDVAFSRLCHERGLRIRFNPGCVAYHFAEQYTRVGRWSLPRARQKDSTWILHRPELEQADALLAQFHELRIKQEYGEAGDCLRFGLEKFPDDGRFLTMREKWLETFGDVSGDRWYASGDPYFQAMIADYSARAGLSREVLPPPGIDSKRWAAAESSLKELVLAAAASPEALEQLRRKWRGAISPDLAFVANFHLEKARNYWQISSVNGLAMASEFLRRLGATRRTRQ